jgi:predicted PurR-regulated permease PerM
VGAQIRASAWQLLLALLVMEAAFGIAGLLASPFYYAYLKIELADRELIRAGPAPTARTLSKGLFMLTRP